MDPFKEFVETNREAFDVHNNQYQEIWEQIESGLDRNRVSRWSNWARVAAAVLIMVVAGWSIFQYQSGEILPYEIRETEKHYGRLIHVKMEQLSAHQQSVDDMIWQDLETLDREYEVLKRDLRENIDQEEVAHAMVENQIAKLEILDQILEELHGKTTSEDAKEIDI